MKRILAGVFWALFVGSGCASMNAGALKGIPVVERPAREGGSTVFVLLVTGDGGWAKIDKVLSDNFTKAGVPVVALNSLKYFWHRKSPERIAADLERLISYYSQSWNKSAVLLVGYSRGAEVIPFAVNKMAPEARKKIRLFALIGPEPTVDFEIRFRDVFNINGKNDLHVIPELEKLRGEKILCFYGKEETDSVCTQIDSGLATSVMMKGKHHFGGDYAPIAKRILDEGR